MNTVDIEQIKNMLGVKVGILEMKINNEEIQDDTAVELVQLYKEYESKGTTLEELKLLLEDVQLALSE